VLLVGSADPIGTTRLLQLLADVRALAPRAWHRVVLTRVRPGPVGRQPERQLTELLARHGAPPAPVLVPDDQGAYDEALVRGRTLREVAPRSPARFALKALAAELVGELAGATGVELGARGRSGAQRVRGR
jgi:Flp pilus assembly CpaE family ATPase